MGLRLKFNLAIVPLAAAVLAFVVWLDYRHEVTSIMAAHALHVGPIGTMPAGPLDPDTLPEVVANRSLESHILYGLLLVSLVVASVNTALHWFVFRPVGRMRARIARIEGGYWRDTVQPTGDDEVGQLMRTLDVLGLEIGAVVGHAVHGEQLAAVALLSRRLTTHLEPDVGQVARIAADLHRHDDPAMRDAGDHLARIATSMLVTVRGLDRVFRSERHPRDRKRPPGPPDA